MGLDSIVKVTISRDIPGITRVGFGTPLFLADISAVTDVVKEYANMDEVSADYAATDPQYKMAQIAFSQEIAPEKIKIGQKLAATAWDQAIQDCLDADDDWYALACDTSTASDIQTIAAKIETTEKFYVGRSADSNCLNNASNIGATLRSLGYSRCAVMYHSTAATAYPECGLFGVCLPYDPGSITWEFKSITGIAADSFTSAERTNLINSGIVFYESHAGTSHTSNSCVSESATFWIDQRRGIDWLKQRLQENVFDLLVRSDKVPQTDEGILSVISSMREILDLAETNNVISEYDITVPKIGDIAEADRAARYLNDIPFTATLAGAWHSVKIEGVVSV